MENEVAWMFEGAGMGWGSEDGQTATQDTQSHYNILVHFVKDIVSGLIAVGYRSWRECPSRNTLGVTPAAYGQFCAPWRMRRISTVSVRMR
jgi:hypothetical protein